MKSNNKKTDNDEELYLIYVLKIGTDHKGNNLYEFIFSHNPDEAEGNGWDEPAHETAEPPYEEYIDEVLNVKTNKVTLDMLHESEIFSIIDGYEGVIALAYENLEDLSYDVNSKSFKRLVFHYGDTYEVVRQKLYERDILLKK